MNPVLIDAIRRQLGKQSTDELLALWTTNDRVMWSPEAFEAVEAELAARGVRELPPQNDPAPLAQPHLPTDVPENVYWMGWLRPVLWIGIATSCLTLFYQVAALWAARPYWTDYWQGGKLDAFVGSMQYIFLPSLLIAGSVACLQFVPWSRTALLIDMWIAIPVHVLDFILQIRDIAWDDAWILYEVTGHAATSAHQMVLPLVLLFLLRRPEIRVLFTLARPSSGFEPALSGEITAAGRSLPLQGDPHP